MSGDECSDTHDDDDESSEGAVELDEDIALYENEVDGDEDFSRILGLHHGDHSVMDLDDLIQWNDELPNARPRREELPPLQQQHRGRGRGQGRGRGRGRGRGQQLVADRGGGDVEEAVAPNRSARGGRGGRGRGRGGGAAYRPQGRPRNDAKMRMLMWTYFPPDQIVPLEGVDPTRVPKEDDGCSTAVPLSAIQQDINLTEEERSRFRRLVFGDNGDDPNADRVAIAVDTPQAEAPPPQERPYRLREVDISTEGVKIHVEYNHTPRVAYYVWQWERSPTTGALHQQGFMILLEPTKFTVVQKLFEPYGRTHIEYKSEYSTINNCRDYCMKEASRLEGCEPVEWGSIPESKQGKRNDLLKIRDEIAGGAEPDDIFIAYPVASSRCVQYVERLSRAYKRKQACGTLRSVFIHTIVGTTGTGKTRYVTDYVARKYGTMEKLHILSMQNGAVWWDGYRGQPVVLFDDFSSHWRKAISLTTFLRYLDSYPIEVTVKGSTMPLMASEIFITSNEHPSMWYASSPSASHQEKPEHIEALMRRLSPKLRPDSILDGLVGTIGPHREFIPLVPQPYCEQRPQDGEEAVAGGVGSSH